MIAGEPRVYLVACVAAKRGIAAPARDLYTSPWFRKARAVAEREADRWYVLSALHGLTPADRVIAPYERTLNHASAAERRAWSERVLEQLDAELDGTEGIVVLAGERYRAYLVPELEARGHQVEIPLRGLGIGRQLQRLGQMIEENA